MRAFAVLGLVAAAQGSNLLYPKGCSDASKANYWPDNPDSEAACLPQATVYCPDPLADNYDAASRKLRPRTSRIPCPPCQPPLPSPARRASAHRLLAHWLVHTRARQTPGAAASPACPPHRAHRHMYGATRQASSGRRRRLGSGGLCDSDMKPTHGGDSHQLETAGTQGGGSIPRTGPRHLGKRPGPRLASPRRALARPCTSNPLICSTRVDCSWFVGSG